MKYDLNEAREALLFALAAEPDLTLYGYPVIRRSDDRFKQVQSIHEDRASLFRENSLDQIATALAWLDLTGRTKTPGHNSYAAKHAAEDWGRETGRVSYVANGVLIAAAIYRGVPVKRLLGSPNALLGLTIKRPKPRPAEVPKFMLPFPLNQ